MMFSLAVPRGNGECTNCMAFPICCDALWIRRRDGAECLRFVAWEGGEERGSFGIAAGIDGKGGAVILRFGLAGGQVVSDEGGAGWKGSGTEKLLWRWNDGGEWEANGRLVLKWGAASMLQEGDTLRMSKGDPDPGLVDAICAAAGLST